MLERVGLVAINPDRTHERVQDVATEPPALGAGDAVRMRLCIAPGSMVRTRGRMEIGVPNEYVSSCTYSELQRRGLFRTEYEGKTLRENLGLPRPPSRYEASSAASAAE